eukprot:2302354-Pyramimonas_sp.AAC.3
MGTKQTCTAKVYIFCKGSTYKLAAPGRSPPLSHHPLMAASGSSASCRSSHTLRIARGKVTCSPPSASALKLPGFIALRPY